MTDAELISEFINRRGYFVLGSSRPLAAGTRIPASHLVADSPRRGPQSKCDSSLSEGMLLYVVSRTDVTDMREQDLLAARICGVDPPAETRPCNFYYRMQAD